MRIRWTPAAAADLKHIHDYLREHEPHLARPTVIEIRNAVRSLKDFPNRGRKGREPARPKKRSGGSTTAKNSLKLSRMPHPTANSTPARLPESHGNELPASLQPQLFTSIPTIFHGPVPSPPSVVCDIKPTSRCCSTKLSHPKRRNLPVDQPPRRIHFENRSSCSSSSGTNGRRGSRGAVPMPIASCQ